MTLSIRAVALVAACLASTTATALAPTNIVQTVDAPPAALSEGTFMDIVFLALGVVFFAVTVVLVHAFERLRKS